MSWWMKRRQLLRTTLYLLLLYLSHHRSYTTRWSNIRTLYPYPRFSKRYIYSMPIPFPRQTRPGPSSSTSSSSSISYPSSSSEASFDEDEERALIQEEWEESLRQMEVVMSIIIMPFFGKWFGRQWAYWGESRYVVVILISAFARYQKFGGLTRSFFALT